MVRKIVSNSGFFDQICQQLALGKSIEIPTKGNSMLPFIIGGRDSLIVEPAGEIAVGDIVLAKVNDKYIAHRIIEIRNTRVLLMGDGNSISKEMCTHDDIYGKITKIIHKGKTIDCNDEKHQRRVALWLKLRPLRRCIMGVWRRTPWWPK